jgi:microcystin degradation protein MlrC
VRVAIAGIGHETNTYADEVTGTTGIDSFQIARGDAILKMRGANLGIGGFLEACDEPGAETVPVFWAYSFPSGTIEADTYASLKAELLERLAAALPVDVVALDIHGAGVAEGVDDIEGDLGAAVRDLVGPDVPLVAALDLHGNVSDEMGALYDGLFGCQLYPHTDLADRGREAVQAAARMLAGEIRPVTVVEHLPMLLPPATTDPGQPAAALNEVCAQVEARPGVIDCTVFHGFPYVDTPAVGAHVVCITDGDPDAAAAGARHVAAWLWEHRDEFRHEVHSPTSAMTATRKLVEEGRVPVVINETSDNPGGGAPGDGTNLLRAMLDAGIEGATFGFIADPETAAAAHAAGVGARIEVRLGGKHGDLHGTPVTGEAYVKSLTDGRFVLQHMLRGVQMDLGPSARLVLGGVEVIVTSNPFQTMDSEIFLLHGIDVTRASVIGLKSSQHFRAGFRDIAAEILTADSPGLTTNLVEVFERTRSATPLWPKDPDAQWT